MLETGEILQLQALADTVIPADNWPGAVEAGVCNFILNLLEHEENWRVSAYRNGLLALDRLAHSVNSSPFHTLTLQQKTELLEMVETRSAEAQRAGVDLDWLRVVFRHCAEGYYADSGNGGNIDNKSWEMVGFKVTI